VFGKSLDCRVGTSPTANQWAPSLTLRRCPAKAGDRPERFG
jgi:hypothetical protein